MNIEYGQKKQNDLLIYVEYGEQVSNRTSKMSQENLEQQDIEQDIKNPEQQNIEQEPPLEQSQQQPPQPQ